MGKYELLATVSLMTGVVAFYHQVFHVFTTKNVTSYSLGALLGNLLAQILLVIYGIANKAYGIYGPTLIGMPGLIYISYLKIFEPVSPEQSKDSGYIKDSIV